MLLDAARPQSRRPSAWGWLVTVSACLVGGGLALTALAWTLSMERRVASYSVRGAVNGVVLDLAAADAELIGGEENDALRVVRTERFAFGHGPVIRREAGGGILRIHVRCPETLIGSCSSGYQLRVPANLQVTVRTTTGDVRVRGYRGSAVIDTGSGDVSITGFCGLELRARSASGDVGAATACEVDRMELRSRTGDVQAMVPRGAYEIDADSDTGERRVEGLAPVDESPFRIQALSSSGDVLVEGAS